MALTQVKSDGIATGAVTAEQIAANAVTVDDIADGSISTAKLADANVTTAKLADDAVTADKLANTAVTAGSYTLASVTVDAQGRITAASSGTAGDSDRIFEGTTSAEVVDTGTDGHFKVITEGTERLRIDSDGVITSIGPSPAQPVYENFLLTDSQTNSTTKRAGISCIHYNTAEEPFAMVHAAAGSSSNSLRIGGNPSTTTANTATEILFHTASNNTTTASSSTERMRLTSDPYLRLQSGGIQFNGDTAAANALDDYEEGTWDPTITASTGTITVNSTYNTLSYTKIGRMVHVYGHIRISSVSGWGAGDLIINGLPYTVATSVEDGRGSCNVVLYDNSAATPYKISVVPFYFIEASTKFQVAADRWNGGWTPAAGDEFHISGSYVAA